MKMYSVKETAEILGMNPETIRRLVREGRFENVVPGRGRNGARISEEDIRKFRFKSTSTKYHYTVYEEPITSNDDPRARICECLAKLDVIREELTSILNELERG